MPTDIIIRKAAPDDCRALGAIHAGTWKTAYKGIVPDSFLEKMSAERSEKRFYDAILQGQENNVVAVKNGRVVGFMCLGKCRDEDADPTCGEIWGIYLLQSHWRQGIGKELMSHGISFLKDEGFQTAALWVLEKNTNARRFYEKLGFSFDGTKKELDLGETLFEIRYVKKL